jgi:hypothetical protein
VSDKLRFQTSVEWITFVCEHYHPGVEMPGATTVYSCRACGALVEEARVAEHVDWHTSLSTSIAVRR